MTQKPTVTPSVKKGNSIVRAIGDLVMLAILLAAAAFAGYFYGLHQQLASAQYLPNLTPVPPAAALAPAPTPPAPVKDTAEKEPAKESQPKETAKKDPPKEDSQTATAAKKHGKLKYWISSTGAEYVGYQITVAVNGQEIDNFFAPGEIVDISKLVKKGQNKIDFTAKPMSAEYNQHKGDDKFALTLNVVAAPHIQDDYKRSDVLLSYSRNAAESEDFSDSKTFIGD